MGKSRFTLRPILCRELGKAFAGNSVNAQVSRKHGILTVAGWTHVAFHRPDGQVAVRRERFDGSIRPQEASLCATGLPWDAHRSINLGVDAAGRTHLVWNAHNTAPLMARSLAANLESGFTEPGIAGGDARRALTYPTFVHRGAGMDPLLLLREGRFDDACWWVRHYDIDLDAWVEAADPFLDGRSAEAWSCGHYLDTPAIDDNGRIHLTWCHRLCPGASDVGLVGNIGISYAEGNRDLTNFLSDRGTVLRIPITPASAQPVTAVGLGAQLMNQCSLAVTRAGRPILGTIWADERGIPQYRLVIHNLDGWRVHTVSNFESRYVLGGHGTLPTPHSRPALLVCDNEDCLLIFRSEESGRRLMLRRLIAPNYGMHDAKDSVLVDEDLGFYEPVVDPGAWFESRRLTIYVQFCNQPGNGDGSAIPKESDAQIMVFEI